jgi:hypothetical protein
VINLAVINHGQDAHATMFTRGASLRLARRVLLEWQAERATALIHCIFIGNFL